GKRRRGYIQKSRRFSVTGLGFLTADWLWELGHSEKTQRPVWIAYAGPVEACRAFTANFRGGRKAGGESWRPLEIPKKSPHRWVHQRRGETQVTVAYIPELFDLDPGLPPDDITFLFAPPTWWLDEQAAVLADDFGDQARDVARAALFVAFVDRRSPLPLVQDLRFHLQLYTAALEEDWTLSPEFRGAFQAERLGPCGLDEPLLCRVGHPTFQDFLTDQTNAYFEKEIRHGQNRFRPDRRVLPYPDRAPAQLCFQFEAA
ncbi:MAG: hypothetical protein GY898_17900, partial [Proteobacteria bacterium]|nr:hypothetical protein [Pseudomonadota bacterium]